MTKEECGFILLLFAITNGLAWLFGWDIKIKDKIIIPNVIVIFLIIVAFALKMMGIE